MPRSRRGKRHRLRGIRNARAEYDVEPSRRISAVFDPGDHTQQEVLQEKLADAHLEEQKVRGAVKTDFILSAEIMTISLAALPALGFWMELGALAVIALGITALVYGSVAIIVKADDVGLALASSEIESPIGSAIRGLGRGLVRPLFASGGAGRGTFRCPPHAGARVRLPAQEVPVGRICGR